MNSTVTSMSQRLLALLIIAVSLLLSSLEVAASTVPVHDPSIVIVYRDADGRSYGEQSAAGDREKFYYVFGTQLGAAYSRDMLNWTAFEPTFAVGGHQTSDLVSVFGENAIWSGRTQQSTLKENLWAADVIWNRAMQKWCMYYSVSGDDWHSSIVMLSSDKVEGPYQRVGSVVFGGMDAQTSGAGNDDFRRVTGQSTIPARYYYVRKGTRVNGYKSGNAWGGDYASSCIDPAVFYDEKGELWMIYGSWSGGIFTLKLDNKTGLRDLSYDYGYSSFASDGAVWDGYRLRYDPYMGVHIAGGYYCSGEGPYIEYIRDASGKGYYYLFISYGFYGPDGGYSMRVFRSDSPVGKFTDVTGDDAVMPWFEVNYGANVNYGVAIMQNYRWSWWDDLTAQTAQGHNSALMDEDGKAYIIYHTKNAHEQYNFFHNVEVHPLVFGSDGWPLVAPFEYRVGEHLNADKVYSGAELCGEYSVITHAAVDYAKLACNTEQTIRLNADHTITGAYTGTWSYDYADGKQYLTLSTSAGTFNGAVLDQRIEDKSQLTLAFTAMNPANELCIWGYKKPLTSIGHQTQYSPYMRIGNDDMTLQWDEIEKFYPVALPAGDFEAKYEFDCHSAGINNWDNWALRLAASNENYWHLRADAYSVQTFDGSAVKYGYDWTWTDDWDTFQDKRISLTVRRQGSTIDVIADVDGKYIYGATSSSSPTTALTAYLGGESAYLDCYGSSVSTLQERIVVGTCSKDGTYPDAFDIASGGKQTFTGDFATRYVVRNFHSYGETAYYKNLIVRNTIGGKTGFVRADRFAFDCVGNVSLSASWGEDWSTFLAMLHRAEVTIDIVRKGQTITYDFTFVSPDGISGTMQAVQSDISAADVTIDLTEENSMIDVESIVSTEIVQCEISESTEVKTLEQVLNAIMVGDKVILSVADGAVARLHSAIGAVLDEATAVDGTVEFDLSRCQTGVYIITADNRAVKIIKKY